MSDRHIRRSGSDYTEAFLALLPQGQAWPKHAPDSVLAQGVAGLCDYWGFVDGRAADLLERESDPRTTIELLPDWERNWGLPDPCYTAPQTIDERQLALVMRMTMQGAQSREFFIEVAAMIGYTITITEYRVWVVGLDRCGDSRVYGDGSDPMRDEWGQPILDPLGDHLDQRRVVGVAELRARAAGQPLLLDGACRSGEAGLVSRHVGSDAASIRICASASQTILSVCSTAGSQRTRRSSSTTRA